ncbi:BglG family transcription antiterminator, partial [Amphibacillus jilinensis]|uniref:BglG family transcription antiterminator n=1 Tax=Amphibacillus jilinensis TaxID=1216008 RepID=UPI000377E098
MSDEFIGEKTIQLIRHFSKREYVDLDILADLMNVSTRSIRNYIKEANKALASIAEIINKRGQGFHLHVYDQANFDEFMASAEKTVDPDSKSNRLASLIEYMIQNDEQLTIDEIAFHMELGRTTLINEISKANSLLSSYRLKIEGKPNQGIYLKGEELDLRFFILDNAFDWMYGYYPLDQDVVDMTRRLCTVHDFETVTENRMIQFIIILLDRVLNGYEIETLDEKFKPLFSSPDFEIASAFALGIEERLPIKISENEILFLTIPISGRRTPTSNRSLAKVEIPEQVHDIVKEIVKEIGFTQDVLTKNHHFFLDFKYHLTFLLNRLTFGIKVNNPLLPDIKRKYPVAFQMAKVAGDVIYNYYDFVVSEHELGYLSFYFEIFISNSESEVINIKKAAIVCGTGRGTAKLLSIQLQKVFNTEITFDLYSEKEITETKLNQYDIVFSTIELPYALCVPSVTISEIFDSETVQKEVEKLQYVHRYGLQNSVKDQYILSSLLKEDLFFKLNVDQSYDVNVTQMVEHLME